MTDLNLELNDEHLDEDFDETVEVLTFQSTEDTDPID
jgi:hypothetical protein